MTKSEIDTLVERQVERMGEALYHLSDQLRGSDWLANEAHHHTYEIVVQEWSVLTDALTTLSLHNARVVEALRCAAVDLRFAKREFLRSDSKEAAKYMERGLGTVSQALNEGVQP